VFEFAKELAMSRKSENAVWTSLLWPSLIAAETGAALTRQMLERFSPPAEPKESAPDQVWASENEIVLELGAARLRRFSSGHGGRRPILVCAPYALHDARLVDLCEGHSLMAALSAAGAPLYLVEWLSARDDQASRGIDAYLADLNVMVDEIGGRCDFIGLCQGGWLSLVYAARFPEKTGRLVLAAAPIDLDAGASSFSELARSTPIEIFQELVRLGKGRAVGAQALPFWRFEIKSPESIHAALQSELPLESPLFHARMALFRAWTRDLLDLPGAYYLEVVEKFYKRNELAKGEFVALGKRIDLANMRRPLYLIAAEQDDVAAPQQTLACAGLVGTPPALMKRRTAPGGHLELFIGAKALQSVWPGVLDWLAAPDRLTPS
jgi:poly(3-hydroxyalkanoate) synthetase